MDKGHEGRKGGAYRVRHNWTRTWRPEKKSRVNQKPWCVVSRDTRSRRTGSRGEAKGEATKEEKEPYRLKQEVSIYLYSTQEEDGKCPMWWKPPRSEYTRRQNKIRGYNQGKHKRPVPCMYVLTSQNDLRSFKFAAHMYNCRERFHLEVRNPVGTQFSLLNTSVWKFF